MIGVLAAAFWLVPALGFMRTAALCVALNALCAALALAWLPRTCAPAAPIAADASRARATLARLFATGLLGIGYEVLVVRVLSQVTEDTVYTFAMLLAVYLAGTALGAAAYARWCPTSVAQSSDDALGDRLLCALAAACLVGTSALWSAEWIKATLLAQWGAESGAGMAAAIGTEAMARARRLRVADARDGRAVQPPEFARERSRRPHSAAFWASTRWARRSRRGCSPCCSRRGSGRRARCCWSRPATWP